MEGVEWGRVKAQSQAPTRKTKNAGNRRHNNKLLIQAVSARLCAATSVLCSCCPSCCAEQSHKDNEQSHKDNEQSHKDSVRSTAVEKQLKQRKSTFEPSSISLLLISSGLTRGDSTT